MNMASVWLISINAASAKTSEHSTEHKVTDSMLKYLAMLTVSLLLIAPFEAVAGSDEESHVTQVAVGYAHTCALLRSGQVYCWGLAHVNGRSEDSPVAVPVEGLPKIKSISAGQVNSCATDFEDQAWCWGVDLQASIKSQKEVITAPKLVAQLPAVSQIASGFLHNCAIAKSDGSVFCWGENGAGELGVGTTDEGKLQASAIPLKAKGLKGATWVATGVNNTCAVVAGGQIYCWGTDDQRGDGVVVKSNVPRHHDESRNVSKVVNGRNFFCALTVDGQVICFGSNLMGQLGSKEAGSIYTQTQPKGIDRALDIGAGGFFACAVTPSKNVLCWGQLPGQDPFEDEGSEPAVVPGLSGVESISLGLGTACAIIRGGRVKCWGANQAGQVGNGIASTEEVTTPADVIGLPGESPFAASLGRALVLQQEGSSIEALAQVDKALQLEPNNVEGMMLRARLLKKLSRFDEAIEDYGRVLRLDQSNWQALRSRADAYVAKGDDANALVDLEAAMILDPSDATQMVERGLILQRRGDTSGAEASFDEARRQNAAIALYYHNLGFTDLLAEEYDSAITKFSTAILLDPNAEDNYKYRADAYEAKGDTSRAEQDRRKRSAVMAAMARFDRLMELGQNQYTNGEFANAIENYTTALEIKPRDASTYYWRGSAFESAGTYDRAIQDFTKAVSIDPSDASNYAARGRAYRKAGDYERAIQDYSSALAIDPRNASNLLLRAMIYDDIEKFDLAVADLTRAIALAPNDPSNYTWRGKAYRSIEKFDLAIADLTRAIALAPNDPFNYTSRAEVYRSIGDYERALTDLSRSVELKPDAYVYSLRGRTYDAMKKPDQAIVEYTNALKFAPTEDRRALYLFYRALTYDDLEAYEPAIADLSAALELSPTDPVYYKWRGIVRRNVGDFEGGLVDLNRAIDLAPDANAYFHRSRLYEDMGKHTLSIADASKAIELAPTTQYYRRRAAAYEASGRNNLALVDCNKAIESDPKQAGGYFCRGDVNFAAGRLQDARNDLDRALAIDPDFTSAYKIRALVYLLSGDTAAAIEDLRKAVSLEPSDSYSAILLEIANRRAGKISVLENSLANLQMKKWPAPVIELLLGRTTADSVIERARSTNSRLERDQLCEANFYVGEWLLLNGLPGDALVRLKYASEKCPHDFIEQTPAYLEVKALESAGEH